MKNLTHTFIFSLLFLTTSLFAQKDKEEPYLVKTYPATDISVATIETFGGSIAVNGQNTDDVRIEVFVHPNNWNGILIDKTDIEKKLKNYTITILKEGNKLIAKAEPKNKKNTNWTNTLSIAFKVYLPEKVSTNVHTSGGSIHVENLTNEISGETSGGSIHVENCHKEINLRTSGGSVHANNSGGNIKLETSAGSLNFENLEGKIIGITSGGGIKANNIKGELIVTTSGGGIHLDNIAASLEASTSAGGIHVSMQALGNYLKLTTSTGGINVKMPLDRGLNLDLDAMKVTIPLQNFDGIAKKGRVKGKLNGGGSLVEMKTSVGNISVN